MDAVVDAADVHVLVLGGWSPGPLDALRWAVRDKAVEFHEPPMHMPPAGCRWCCTWEAALLGALVYLCISLVAGDHSARQWPVGLQVGALLLSVGGIFVAVVLLVRGSIRRSVQTAANVIAQQHIDVVVGFSWGGGVGCWLLANGHIRWRGPTILLAPTVAAMASAACLPLPRFYARAEESTGATSADAPAFVQVFHATDDGFCPDSQHAALAATGAATFTCRDIHIFAEPRSEQEIVAAFASAVRAARPG